MPFLATEMGSRRMPGVNCVLAVLLVAFAVLAGGPTRAQGDGWRTIEIETSEVTAADVAVSPTGDQLVFTLLGHLFSMPPDGGDARQLTFGPHRNFDPTFSPDGGRIAFSSNRDGSDGNVFVLDLADGSVTQATRQREAIRPTFSPDGMSISYISRLTRGHHCPTADAVVRRVELESGVDAQLRIAEGPIRSVLYLPGGELAWTVHVRGSSLGREDDRTEVRVFDAEGLVVTVAAIPAIADRTIRSADGAGFVARVRPGSWEPEYLAKVGPSGELSKVTSLSPQPCFYGSPRIAISTTSDVFLGDVGRLWRVSLAPRIREPIAFRARARLSVRDRPIARRLEDPLAAESFSLRSLQTPILSPGGNRLIFGAAGYLWRHDLVTGTTSRLTREDGAFERHPALSPDGRRLAFVWSDGWRSELRVSTLATGAVDRLERDSDGASSYWHPAWSPDGTRLAFATSDSDGAPQLAVIELNPEGGLRERKHLRVPGLDDWSAHPWFSADGTALFYAAAPTDHSAVYRVAIDDPTDVSRVTSRDLGHAHRPATSEDDSWLIYRHNSEIWRARLESGAVVDGSALRVARGRRGQLLDESRP